MFKVALYLATDCLRNLFLFYSAVIDKTGFLSHLDDSFGIVVEPILDKRSICFITYKCLFGILTFCCSSWYNASSEDRWRIIVKIYCVCII